MKFKNLPFVRRWSKNELTKTIQLFCDYWFFFAFPIYIENSLVNLTNYCTLKQTKRSDYTIVSDDKFYTEAKLHYADTQKSGKRELQNVSKNKLALKFYGIRILDLQNYSLISSQLTHSAYCPQTLATKKIR